MQSSAKFDKGASEVVFILPGGVGEEKQEETLDESGLNTSLEMSSGGCSIPSSPRHEGSSSNDETPLMKKSRSNKSFATHDYDQLSGSCGKKGSIDNLAMNGSEAKQLNYFQFKHFGLFLQYFCVGICYSATIGVNYEFFTSYLGQSGNFFNVARTAMSIPWSFKFIYGAINDCFPIMRYRRKPYMIIGWIGCVTIGSLAYILPLPESRFEHDEAEISNGHCDIPGHIKPNSTTYYTNEAIKYMTLLFFFNVFMVLTDVAMDGLMVEYARKEPLKTRGRAQTMIYVTRQLGMICGGLIKGFGLNWYPYSGPWCHGIEMTHLFLIITITSGCAIPIVAFMTTEDQVKEPKTVGHVCSKTWSLLQSTAVQQVLAFQIASSILSNIASPADSMILRIWIDVDNLTKNVIVGVFGGILFAIGSTVFAKYLLNYSWVLLYGSTMVIVTVLNSTFTYLVVFDVVRTKYLYVSDELSQEFFVGVNYICALLLFIELSEADTEGLSYALLTTTTNASSSLGGILGNFIVYPFGVSERERFDRDSPADRNAIAIQYGIIYACNLSLLLFLPLLPAGKKETQELKQNASKSNVNGIITVCLIGLFLTFSLTYSFVLYRIFPH